MENLKRFLVDHPFFEGMEEHHLDFIVGCASNAVFQEGEFLYREGGHADRFFLIRSGKVALQVHAPGRGPMTVDTLEQGEVVGWSWLINSHKARFDAVAIDQVRAIALNGDCIRQKCEADHELGYQMLTRVAKIMDQRIHATRYQLLDLYGSPL